MVETCSPNLQLLEYPQPKMCAFVSLHIMRCSFRIWSQWTKAIEGNFCRRHPWMNSAHDGGAKLWFPIKMSPSTSFNQPSQIRRTCHTFDRRSRWAACRHVRLWWDWGLEGHSETGPAPVLYVSVSSLFCIHIDKRVHTLYIPSCSAHIKTRSRHKTYIIKDKLIDM